MKITFAEVRKTLVAAVGVVAEAVNGGLIHGTAARIAAVVIAAATAVGVYAAPNDPKAALAAPPAAK